MPRGNFFPGNYSPVPWEKLSNTLIPSSPPPPPPSPYQPKARASSWFVTPDTWQEWDAFTQRPYCQFIIGPRLAITWSGITNKALVWAGTTNLSMVYSGVTNKTISWAGTTDVGIRWTGTTNLKVIW